MAAVRRCACTLGRAPALRQAAPALALPSGDSFTPFELDWPLCGAILLTFQVISLSRSRPAHAAPPGTTRPYTRRGPHALTRCLTQTRAGRVFSPYNTIASGLDTVRLVELALSDDQQGLDSWELAPLTPLSSPDLSGETRLPHLPSGDPSCDPLPPPLFGAAPAVFASRDNNAANSPGSSAGFPPAAAPPPSSHTSADPLSEPRAAQMPAAGGPSTSHRSVHSKNGKRARRQRKRAEAQEAGLGRKARSSHAKRAAQAAALPRALDASQLPIANGAYTGKNLTDAGAPCRTLEELVADGYTYFEWDGAYVNLTPLATAFPHRSTPPSTPFKIVDKDGRVIGLLAGRPADASWDDVASSAYSAMAEAAEACQFKPKHSDHRRGQFATLATGVSFGGGRTVR